MSSKIIHCAFLLQAISYLWGLLDPNSSEDKLLRVVTLVANIVSAPDQQFNGGRQFQAPTQDTSLASSKSCDKHGSSILNGASLTLQLSHTYEIDIFQ